MDNNKWTNKYECFESTERVSVYDCTLPHWISEVAAISMAFKRAMNTNVFIKKSYYNNYFYFF